MTARLKAEIERLRAELDASKRSEFAALDLLARVRHALGVIIEANQ